jgi:hypothetical protein
MLVTGWLPELAYLQFRPLSIQTDTYSKGAGKVTVKGRLLHMWCMNANQKLLALEAANITHHSKGLGWVRWRIEFEKQALTDQNQEDMTLPILEIP